MLLFIQHSTSSTTPPYNLLFLELYAPLSLSYILHTFRCYNYVLSIANKTYTRKKRYATLTIIISSSFCSHIVDFMSTRLEEESEERENEKKGRWRVAMNGSNFMDKKLRFLCERIFENSPTSSRGHFHK